MAWKVAAIGAVVLVLVPAMAFAAFFWTANHVMAQLHLAVAPPPELAVDAYRAAESCPFATGGDAGRAFGAAFLVGSAWVLTSDGTRYGGYRNPLGSQSAVPEDLRPSADDLASIRGELGLTRTLRPEEWTTVVSPGEPGIGFLLIRPSDWRAWVLDVPATVSRPVDPYKPSDAFVVMACHLRALERSANVDEWGALALWTVTQLLTAELNGALSRGENVLGIVQSLGRDLLGSSFANAVAGSMGVPAPLSIGQVGASQAALSQIPADYLALIQRWAAAYGIDWTVLAGVLKVEDGFGRGCDRSPAGAVGPAQFEPGTFQTYGVDDTGDGRHDQPDICNVADAVASAAHYLSALGASNPATLWSAVCHYNAGPASLACGSYANTVLAAANSYRAPVATAATAVAGAPTQAAAVAMSFAFQKIGTPYEWGGTGAPGHGFDCSGLTQAAYAAAGIHLPRTADEQLQAGPRVPAGQPLLPGDLVFFLGSDSPGPGQAGHVGIAISGTQMIDAPYTGQLVRREAIYSQGYLGATRPSAAPKSRAA